MEEVQIIYITPEMYNYKDRGIKKWRGLFLSDHTEELKKEMNRVTEIKGKEEMTELEIGEVLYKAYTNDLPISIQANVIKNGNFYKDLECTIAGYANGQIYLDLKDGRTTSCVIEEIRYVEFMELLDWQN